MSKSLPFTDRCCLKFLVIERYIPLKDFYSRMTRTGERSVDKCLVSLELCNKALHDSWYPKVVPQSLS